MRVTRIELQNVMRFEKFEVAFAPSFNVIIGENGAGKTTLLTLLERALAAWTPRERRRPLARELVREVLNEENGRPFWQPQRPWHLVIEGVGPDGGSFRHVEEDGRRVVGNVAASRLHRHADADVHLLLPVLAYFSPWREPPRPTRPLTPSGPPRRLDGYAGALDLHADFRAFARWFTAFEMQFQMDGVPIPAVEAVRTAVMRCIPGCTGLHWLPGRSEIVATIAGVAHPVTRLSDGFRTVLALVGEIAWRAAILNPALGADLAERVTGVVLIDEIDLHLHPSWQRRVVDDLRRAFPKVQFIATTHSPIVVQSMGADEVVNLDGRPSLEFQRSSVEDIVEDVMGVEDIQRSARFHRMIAAAERYFGALEREVGTEADRSSLKAELDQLVEPFADNPAYVALLRSARAARRLDS